MNNFVLIISSIVKIFKYINLKKLSSKNLNHSILYHKKQYKMVIIIQKALFLKKIKDEKIYQTVKLGNFFCAKILQIIISD